MLSSKDRNYLRKCAHDMSDIIHIGKDGVLDNTVVQVSDAIKKRELIKGKIQQNSLEEVREVANFLAEKTGSEVVCTIGNKFILYKRNKDINQYNV